MKNLSRPQSDSRWYGKPVTIIISIVLIALFGIGVWGMSHSYNEALRGRNRVKEDLARINEQSHQVNQNLERLSTERGQEEEFRTRYRAVKPGEELIIVVPPDAEETGTVEGEDRVSFGRKIILFLKKVF